MPRLKDAVISFLLPLFISGVGFAKQKNIEPTAKTINGLKVTLTKSESRVSSAPN